MGTAGRTPQRYQTLMQKSISPQKNCKKVLHNLSRAWAIRFIIREPSGRKSKIPTQRCTVRFLETFEAHALTLTLRVCQPHGPAARSQSSGRPARWGWLPRRSYRKETPHTPVILWAARHNEMQLEPGMEI